MDALPHLLFLIQQTRPEGPLALLAGDGEYTHASALAVIMQRAGFPVRLAEGSFRYGTLTQRNSMGLYGVWVPQDSPAEDLFVSPMGDVGTSLAIRCKLADWLGPAAVSVEHESVILDEGSVPPQEHLEHEHRRGENATQRALPALLAQGVALIQERLLQGAVPAAMPHRLPASRL